MPPVGFTGIENACRTGTAFGHLERESNLNVRGSEYKIKDYHIIDLDEMPDHLAMLLQLSKCTCSMSTVHGMIKCSGDHALPQSV